MTKPRPKSLTYRRRVRHHRLGYRRTSKSISISSQPSPGMKIHVAAGDLPPSILGSTIGCLLTSVTDQWEITADFQSCRFVARVLNGVLVEDLCPPIVLALLLSHRDGLVDEGSENICCALA